MSNKKALICTIGDEILIGQIHDTNSKWLSEELTLLGFEVRERVTIQDRKKAILGVLGWGFQEFDLIIMTGGLGPTKDDITKNTIAEFLGERLVENKDVLASVTRIFEKYNRPLLEVNKLQAHIPESCIPLQNKWGTAPGMLFEKKGKMLISLPGVPHEMKNLMSSQGFDRIRNFFHTGTIVFKTVKTVGIGESFLMEKIKDWEEALPANIKLAYLPSAGEVKLRLTAQGTNTDSLEKEIESQIDALKRFASKYIYGRGKISLSKAIGQMLEERGETLSTAESCTGGMIAHLITSEPGSSAYFPGSIVSYSNEAKMDLLGVKKESLEKYGAVSEQVVGEMAMGACKKFNSSYAIATSGIAGPDGGTEEKPVGTIWIAVSNGKEVETKLLKYQRERLLNIELTAKSALNLLRIWLSK